MPRQTESERIAAKNAAYTKKRREDAAKVAALHDKIRKGEMTAGEALQLQNF